MARPVILSGVPCYFCGSDQTSKAGRAKGKQRYKCRGCGRFFISDAERVERPTDSPGSRVVKRRQYERSLAEGSDADPFHPVKNPTGRKQTHLKKRPSASHLILKLRAIAQSLGRTPTTTEIAELGKQGRSYKLADYYDVFGSYLAAVKKARLKLVYKQEFDEHDKERMLGELRRLRKKLKRPIFNKDVVAAKHRGEVSPVTHFQKAFGSVPKAIEAISPMKNTKVKKQETHNR